MGYKRVLAVALAAAVVFSGSATAAYAGNKLPEAGEVYGGSLSAGEVVSLGEYNVQTYEYSYSMDFNTIFSTTVGGIKGADILEAAESLIISNEGNYASVAANDNGALSIGKLQWHANRALQLLKDMVSNDNDYALETLGEDLYDEICSAGLSDWSDRTLNADETALIKAFLNIDDNPYSKTVQDELADSDVSAYLNQGYSQGIRNAAALVFYADFANQYGQGSATNDKGAYQMGIYACNLADGDWSAVTLNEMLIASVCYNYARNGGVWYDCSYVARRFKTYGTITGYGWAYCNSGDYLIPYANPWSDGKGVTWLQNALNDYQNAELALNGSYDEDTKAAVKAFQAANSDYVDVDGYAGKLTVSILMYRLYYSQMVEDGELMGATAVVTDIVKDTSTGKWEYTVNGAVDYSYTGVAKNKNGWWYVYNGVVDFTYEGFGHNANGWWYVKNGKVDFTKNSVIKDNLRVVDGEKDWWYVVGGKVQTSFTGLANYKNANGWWYIKDGKVDFTKNTVAKNKNGWWYVVGGKVQFGFTGLANYSNANGWWYIEKGKVKFDYTGIAQNKNGWWYVKNSKVRFDYTGKVTSGGKTYQVTKGKVKK